MTRPDATVDELVARGGWTLDDARARHEANPDTFSLPAGNDLARLGPGMTARLLFLVLDQAEPICDDLDPYAPDGTPNLVIGCERMWVWVEAVDGDDLIGILQNLPGATHTRLVPGARVRFRRTDVIDLDLDPPVAMGGELAAMAETGYPVLAEDDVLQPEDPRRPPSIAPRQAAACERAGVRPERPWVFSRMLADPALGPDADPVYGLRFPPNQERRDCGWIMWTGDADLDVALERGPFEVIEVGALRARNVRAWEHLALPPGWAFVLGPDGSEDMYEDVEVF